MSLRDQLLKSGAASKKQHQAARSHKKKNKKQVVAVNDKEQQVKQQALKALAERKEKDKARNAELEQQRACKALYAQVRQLLEKGKIQRLKGEIIYYFKANNAVKKWYLSAQQIDQLAVGSLAIVLFEEKFFLIDRDTAIEVRKRGPEFILVWHQRDTSKKEATAKGSENLAEEDPYAAYKIPDDLDW